jgi:transcription antitermination factor NusG
VEDWFSTSERSDFDRLVCRWETPCLSEDGEALSVLNAYDSGSDLTVARINHGRATATDDSAPVWLAAYTTSRHEKVVARHFEVRNVEHFLPLYRVVRRWKNGCTVPVELPVFPNYVFVRTGRNNTSRLLEVPGLLAFVGAGRTALPVPDAEIDLLQKQLPLRKFEPHPYLVAGSKVRIAAGPLAGTCGVLLRKKSGLRVVLSIDLIRQSVAVEVDSNEIEPL